MLTWPFCVELIRMEYDQLPALPGLGGSRCEVLYSPTGIVSKTIANFTSGLHFAPNMLHAVSHFVEHARDVSPRASLLQLGVRAVS